MGGGAEKMACFQENVGDFLKKDRTFLMKSPTFLGVTSYLWV